MAHRGQISFLSIRKTLIYSRADQAASPPPKANTHRKHGSSVWWQAGGSHTCCIWLLLLQQVGLDFTLKPNLRPSSSNCEDIVEVLFGKCKNMRANSWPPLQKGEREETDRPFKQDVTPKHNND